MSTIASDFAQAAAAVRKGWRRMQGPMRRRMLVVSGEYVKTSSRGKR